MSLNSLLVTVSADSCGNFKKIIDKESEHILHLPLDNYQYEFQRGESDDIISNLSTFSFVIYGSLRNAAYFIKWVHEKDLLNKVQTLVHFSMDEPASAFLESNGIPSVMPRENAAPIDILEFLLRISREGKTLYPAVDGKAEEIPGLLKELEMEVVEFLVCKEVKLPPDTLREYKQRVTKQKPDTVLFHNRSSLTRTKTAFPDLNLQKMKVISGSAGVTQALIDLGIEPDFEADATWLSIQNWIEERVLT
ncbi:hypothetical protein BH23BAC3_BH23BAC3_21970 [soil metagenome]